MIGTLLSDEAWTQIESVLPGTEGDPGRTAADDRWFVGTAACCTGLETSSNVYSISSNIFVVPPLATTSFQATI